MNEVRSLKKFTNGRTIQDTLNYMENLVKAGVDLFDVDLGCYDNWWLPHPPAGMPAGCFLEISEIVKKHFAEKNIRSNVGIEVPVVAVGKLGYPDLAERAIREGQTDMIMLARPLLADAYWCNKAYAGEVERICPCIGCQEGCLNEFIEGGHIQCAVNPRTGFENEIPAFLPPAATKKKIAVVGAGPAGIEFAITAVRRGHTVDLFEKDKRIGGKVLPGSIPKIKFDFENYLHWLENEVEVAQSIIGFSLKLDTPVENGWLKAQSYDTVVYAIGTKSATPPIPGIREADTVEATDLLLDETLLRGAKKIVVVGGGVVGCETAYWLSYEKGCEVTVVEMLPHFMEGACTANRGHLLHYMEKADIRLINCAKVTALEKGMIRISRNISDTVPNPYNTWQPILPENVKNPLAKKLLTENRDENLAADLVVLAMGGRPDDAMFMEGQRDRVAPEIYNIGDSYAAGRVLEASRAAYHLAREV